MRSSSIVTGDEGFKVGYPKNVFYKHPESSRYENNKLQDYAVIAINFSRARSSGATPHRMAARVGDRNEREDRRTFCDLSHIFNILEHEFYVRES